MAAAPKFPLGIYVWNPSSTDPNAEAVFENQFNDFTDAMGAKPTFMNAFTDYYVDWSLWVGTEQGLIQSWVSSPVLKGVTPVMTLPMATNADWNNQDADFKAIIAGKYDSVYTGLIDAWKSAGYSLVYARIGPEMNGGFEPWFMGNDPQTVADWVAAFQHIANLVHNISGITVKTVWNPADMNWTAQPTSSAYPGDQYVDVMGADVYSKMYPLDLYDWGLNNGTVDTSLPQWFANPVNRIHYWMYPGASQWAPTGYPAGEWGFAQVLQFAEAHHKPLGIAESGGGGDGVSTGPTDDPQFVKWFYSELSQPGAPQVAFVNIWDINPGDGNWTFTDGSKPQESAAWQQYFGVPGAGYPIPSAIGSGPDQIVLAISEDAYLGNAEFTVGVDGVQQGGVLTAAAPHGSGKFQDFTLNGTWTSSQSHAVKVTFINDAWGGMRGLDRNLYIDSVNFDGVVDQTNLLQATNGSKTIGIGPTNSSIAFTDSANAHFTTNITPDIATEFGSWQTGLQGNIFESAPSSGVTNFGAESVGPIQSAALTDALGLSWGLSDFVEADASVTGGPTAGGSASTLKIDHASRGTVAVGTGNYRVSIAAESTFGGAAENTFNVTLGGGTDSLAITGESVGIYARVSAGAGADQMSFIGLAGEQVTGGAGSDTVSLGAGPGTAIAGAGSMTVSGGAGVADTYIFHAGMGLLTIQDFLPGKGDVLEIDSALQSKLIETKGSSGLLLSFGTGANHGIMLSGVGSLPSSDIRWI